MWRQSKGKKIPHGVYLELCDDQEYVFLGSPMGSWGSRGACYSCYLLGACERDYFQGSGALVFWKHQGGFRR